MKKKMLAVMVGLLMVAALVGAGTFAYFSDTEASTDNTFTAGTLDMALSNDGVFGGSGSVTGTWVSPANWAPGQSVTATLHFTNKGSVASPHIYFKFVNLAANGNGDGSNLAERIIVSELKERFNGVTTGDQAAYIDNQVGNHDGV
ncbi:MAG: TasA family protein, partial [Thermacetogeniaceae bacterium]